MLQVENVNVSYGTRLVLKNINFKVLPGCVLGIAGPNGSGKSTLIRTLSGILPLQSGSIWVQGQELDQLSLIERARRIAVVPQAVNMPPAFTAWETVILGRTPHLNWLGQISEKDEIAARHAMERTQTLELAERYVGELSGGEQQRLLLARALAQAAPVLLMDEPTAHLDLHHQIHLLEEICRLAHKDGLTVLMVLHDLNLIARFADKVALLVDGRLQPPGRPEDVLTADRLSKVYQVPLQTIRVGATNRPVILPV